MKKLLLLLFLLLNAKIAMTQCSVQIAFQSANCNGQTTNSVIANATGVAPFQYLWSNGDIASIADSIPGNDTINVTIIDSTGCVATDTGIFVGYPTQYSINVTNASCPSCCNGSVTLSLNYPSTLCPINNYLWTVPIDQWNPVQITTVPTLTGICPGTYTVVVNTDCGCMIGQFAWTTSINTTGLSDYSSGSGWNMYPNPAADELTIETALQEQLDTGRIEIYSMEGKLVQGSEIRPNESKQQVSLKELPNGIYITKLLKDNRVITNKRLVIMR